MLTTSLLFFSIVPAYGEIIIKDQNLIGDLLISKDKSKLYFFEIDDDIKSEYWIKDTRIYTLDGSEKKAISNEYFAYPTELREHEGNLIFATLSDECLENVTCDFQDVILMSKENGEYRKIIHQLKSAIHLSVSENSIFLSESNGKIWKYDIDGNNGNLIYQGDHLIMDITSDKDSVFWIEEINDEESQIVSTQNGKDAHTIVKKLYIPHDIKIVDDKLIWNEILFKVNSEGKLREHTAIQTLKETQIQTLAEFENKIPISSTDKDTFGPYRSIGSYLFLINNTADKKGIHLLDLERNENFLLEMVDYNVNYFRNDANNLYIVGNIDGAFFIDRFTLPVTVPEFPFNLIILVVGFVIILTVSSRQFFQN